jgi:hypothetical protein
MAEVELSIGASHLELRFSGGDGAAAADRAPPAIVVPLPKPVDPDAAEAARFSRKSGQLRVSLRVASQ